MNEDTIAAISTSLGESGIGIVRLSGKESIQIVSKIFLTKKEKDLKKVFNFSTHYGNITDPKSKTVIDEVLVTVMKAPFTYTKEDIVEINCHGGIVPLRKVLELVIRNGARLAEPGEFTKRAFLNGRIDLAQAEAVSDIIKAKTDESLKEAVNQLKGSLSKEIHLIADELKSTCALLEARIEFPEDDIETGDLTGIKENIEKTSLKISKLLDTFNSGRILRDGVKTTIVGKPNVGKSSLLNELLQEERSIVTHIPGTTRDVIEESVNIDGTAFVISDTAGIRESEDYIEKKGIERSVNSIKDADLVLFLLDGSKKIGKDDYSIFKRIEHKNRIVIINKIDIKEQKLKEEEAKIFTGFKSPIKISVLTKEGINNLKEAMKDAILEKGKKTSDEVIVTNVRHKDLLGKALNSLKEAVFSIDKNMSEEFIVVDVKDSLDSIGEITGKISTEDILRKIFSDFCIGK